MHGHIDSLTADTIVGWCREDVYIVIDRRFVFEVRPDIERQDLVSAGIDGRGFRFEISKALPDYSSGEIFVRTKSCVHPIPGGYYCVEKHRPYLYVSSEESNRVARERLLEGVVRGIVLFTARSGSTFLLDVIRNHQKAYVYAEPLDLLSIHGDSAVYNWMNDYFICPSRVEYFKKVEDPRLILFSTKLEDRGLEIMRAFNYYKPKFFRLYRKNVFKQALSHIRAGMLYKETSDFNVRGKTAAHARMTINVKELLFWIFEFQQAEAHVDHLITNYAEGDFMSVAYEDISGEKSQAVFNQVFDYFGLDPIPIKTDYKKINRDLHSWIENYEEVHREISKTRFAWMLEPEC